MELDFEHWNHVQVYDKVEILKKSEGFQNFSFKEKLYLYFFQVFSIEYWGFSVIPSNILDVFDTFDDLISPDLTKSEILIFYLAIKIKILDFKKEVSLAIPLIEKGEELFSSLEPYMDSNLEIRKFVGLFYYSVSAINKFIQAPYESQLQTIHKCKNILEELDNPFYNYICYSVELKFYVQNKKYDTEIEFIFQSINSIRKKKHQGIYISAALNNLAEVYALTEKQDLKKAVQYNEANLQLIESYNSEFDKEITIFLRFLAHYQRGNIEKLIGDIDSSLYHYQESLNLCNFFYDAFGREINKASSIGNLGELYAKLGKFDLALEFQLNSLELLLNESNNALVIHRGFIFIDIADTYYQLIKTLLSLKRTDYANIYFEKLQNLKNKKNWLREHSDLILAYNKIAQALILIENWKFMDLGQAKQILSEVITMPVKFELIADSLIPLIEIVLLEYKFFQKRSSLKEFNELSNFISDLFEKNNSIVLKINLLILQGKIAFINGEIAKFKSFYNKSLTIAQEFHQLEIIKKIKSELQVIEINSLKNELNWSLKERFDLVQMDEYIKEAFKIVENP